MSEGTCTCPRDQYNVVTQYQASCPVPPHRQAPWPLPQSSPPAPPCVGCYYNTNGTLVKSPGCPCHGQ